MFPAERRQMGQHGSGYVFELAQNIDGAFQISGVPKDDGRARMSEADAGTLSNSKASRKAGDQRRTPAWRSPRTW